MELERKQTYTAALLASSIIISLIVIIAFLILNFTSFTVHFGFEGIPLV
ncbi:MAG: hypothetical protein ACTSRS_13095 [Candidatus Helarchaeota archaeon]